MPARVSVEAVEQMIALLGTGVQDARIDLDSCQIALGNQELAFDLDPTWRTKLIKGWDDIDLTRAEASRITAFRTQRKTNAPWAWPDSGTP